VALQAVEGQTCAACDHVPDRAEGVVLNRRKSCPTAAASRPTASGLEQASVGE